MNNQTGERKLKNGLILTLFVLSAAIGLALITVSVWGDYESTMIDVNYIGRRYGNIAK